MKQRPTYTIEVPRTCHDWGASGTVGVELIIDEETSLMIELKLIRWAAEKAKYEYPALHFDDGTMAVLCPFGAGICSRETSELLKAVLPSQIIFE